MSMLLTTGGSSFSVVLPDEEATRKLMIDIAGALRPGDTVTLSGDLGAGKTTFVRALIRYLAGDETIEVPSPTFTLMQTYDLSQFPLVHADLYRLSGAAEMSELGFDDLPEDAVIMIARPARCRRTGSTSRSRLLPSSSSNSATRASPAMAASHRGWNGSRRRASS